MIKKRIYWVGSLVLAWQFVGCSTISEQTTPLAHAYGTVAYQIANRRVYKYSVIPGGVFSGAELARARRTDAVVAAHYADFANDAYATRLREDQLVYISYRKANKVYWTQRKHLVCKGEAVITDGKNTARSRCGNRLSKTPHLPTSKSEPATAQLNSPETPPQLFAGPVAPPNLVGPAVTGAGTPEEMPLITTGASKGLPLLAGAYPPVVQSFGAGPIVGPGGLRPSGKTPVNPTTPGGTTTPTGGGTTTPVPVSTPTPEPATLLLLLAGCVALFGCRLRGLR